MSFVTEQHDTKAATLQAALAWWEALRPVSWTLRQHLDNPTINAGSKVEKALATAVAKAVEAGAI